MNLKLNKQARATKIKIMKYTDVQTTTTDNTTQEARHLFYLENNLENKFALGFITEEEYEVERDNIFQSLGELYGFEG
tara:strand:- start:466 stop:699 length:234 start_codon:yes stop_codon:yes gene_type:complete